MPPLRMMAPLPRVLVLTDRALAASAGRQLAGTVAMALAGIPAGGAAVVFREKDLPPAERLTLGREVAAAVHAATGVLVVASDAALATELGAAAVHLAAADRLPPERAGLALGRSCHDAREVAAAIGDQADYVTVSPVFPTPSKPGYGPALGAGGLGALVAVAGATPVFALGGVDPGRVAACLGAGAYGVAVMGAVMAAADPGDALAALVGAAAAGSRP